MALETKAPKGLRRGFRQAQTPRGPFTPGPWQVVETASGFAVEAHLPCINGLSAWFEIARFESDPSDQMAECGIDHRANAYLFAAARDMFEALGAAEAALAAACAAFGHLDAIERAVTQVRAAAAKAIGNHPSEPADAR